MEWINSNAKSWDNILDTLCLLGEGPVWDAASKSILWIDILRGNIHRFSPELNKTFTICIGHKIGAVALRSAGGCVLALRDGFYTMDWESHALNKITDPEAHLPNNRFNDGKCDPAGRFWAGTMDEVQGRRGVGNLYMLDTDLSVAVKISGVSCSNGLAWSPDKKTLYYIDTPTRQVVAYNYDVTTGDISHKKVVISVPEEEGVPDGMTIDKEGMLWIAHWNGWKVSRWNPFTGKLLLNIRLPVSRVTSCTFGGNNLDDLYITSARTGLSEAELASQPLAGSLFVIKNTGYQGMEAFTFKG